MEPQRPASQKVHLFYASNQLVSQIGPEHTRLMRSANSLLAELSTSSMLLQVDCAGSVAAAMDDKKAVNLTYLPYGYSNLAKRSVTVGFTGERLDLKTGGYLFGLGHRLFNPYIQRFVSPDVLSPFGKGGFNAYAYCEGDPINYIDPTGNMKASWSGLLKKLRLKKKTGFTRNMDVITSESKMMPALKKLNAISQDDFPGTVIECRGQLNDRTGRYFSVTKKEPYDFSLVRANRDFQKQFRIKQVVHYDLRSILLDREIFPAGKNVENFDSLLLSKYYEHSLKRMEDMYTTQNLPPSHAARFPLSSHHVAVRTGK